MSYVVSLYHLVFTTHRRQPVIAESHCETLYRVLASEIAKTGSKALIVNGVQNHVHVLLSLSPQIALSSLVRDVKSKSSVWMKSSGLFPLFDGWEKEYGAFSLSANHKESVYQYIVGQKGHHAECNLEDEFKRLVLKAGLQLYEG